MSRLSNLARKARALLPYVGILFATQTLGGTVWIPSASMEPTMHAGDMLTVNRLAYSFHLPFVSTAEVVRWATPDRGEIIVFNAPPAGSPSEALYIKRVVAVAGDVIEVKDHRLTLNGKAADYSPVDAEYLTETLNGKSHQVHAQPSELQNFGPYTVPAGHVFVMGDNRDHSSDSRMWGPLALERVRGRASYRVLGANPSDLKGPGVL